MKNHVYLTAYHGSNSIFDKFDQSKARIANDFYGGGVAYFTDDHGVGKQYAKAMSKKGGVPTVYKVSLRFSNLFDVDHQFTGDDLTKLIGTAHSDIDAFARGAGMLKPGVDQYAIKAELKNGTTSLSGDQVFRGLSRGMVNTAAARAKLINVGYDGLRYNGGLNMNAATKHNVYLAYFANDIRIISKESLK